MGKLQSLVDNLPTDDESINRYQMSAWNTIDGLWDALHNSVVVSARVFILRAMASTLENLALLPRTVGNGFPRREELNDRIRVTRQVIAIEEAWERGVPRSQVMGRPWPEFEAAAGPIADKLTNSEETDCQDRGGRFRALAAVVKRDLDVSNEAHSFLVRLHEGYWDLGTDGYTVTR